MRTLLAALAGTLLAAFAAPASAQCTDLGGGCLRATAQCQGTGRICCPFTFGATNLDPFAPATFVMIGNALRQPIPFASTCAPNSFCTLHIDPTAHFLLAATVDPVGGSVITGTVPCDPAIVGTGFAFQYAQVQGVFGRTCVGLTNGVQVTFQARGICR